MSHPSLPVSKAGPCLEDEVAIACRIPADIILEIVNAFKGQTSGDDAKQFHSLHWVRLSHLCRRWRSVIIGTPLLWTSIQANSVERAVVFAERSQHAPINLFLSQRLPEHELRTFTDLARSQSHRINSLWLCLPSADLVGIVSSIGDSLPQLRLLSLTDPGNEGNFAPTQLAFQPNRRSYSPLHTLILDNVILSWDLLHLTDLRVLKISRLRSRFTELHRWLRLSEFLDILDSCPSLEKLSVTTSGPLFQNIILTHGDKTRVVELPCLKELELNNSPVIIAMTLAHLRIPETTKILLKPSMFRGLESHFDPGYITPFPSPFSRNLPVISHLERLYIHSDWDNLTTIVKAGSLRKNAAEEEEWPFIVEFDWKCNHEVPYIIGEAITRMNVDLGHVLGQNILDLVIEGHLSCHTNFRTPWEDLFSHLPQLRSFTLRHLPQTDPCDSDHVMEMEEDALEKVVNALRVTDRSPDLLCPSLKEIRLKSDVLCYVIRYIHEMLKTRVSRTGRLPLLELGMSSRRVDPEDDMAWEDVTEVTRFLD